MATTLAPVDSREVVRCDVCSLVQFRTNSSNCRRCHQSLDEPEPEAVVAPAPADTQAPPQHPNGNDLQIARAIRALRQRAGLSQRQLAMRMQVPRTYVSKIENDKAMPTLSSMQRLADALQVTIPDLLRGGELTMQERARELTADPFLAQMLPDLLKLDAMQRQTLIGELRTMALRGRRTS